MEILDFLSLRMDFLVPTQLGSAWNSGILQTLYITINLLSQAVYYVKRRPESIKKDNFHDLVMFGDLSHLPLDHFTSLMETVRLCTHTHTCIHTHAYTHTLPHPFQYHIHENFHLAKISPSLATFGIHFHQCNKGCHIL